jgi:hypothetical protein
MSLTHLHSVKASTTRLLLAIFLGIMAATRGEMPLIRCPDSHLSCQNRVLVPSPTFVITAMEKKASIPALTCSGKAAQGLLGSVFLIYNHLSLSAQLRCLRSEMPSPPNSFGRVTFGHAIKQCPPDASFIPATNNSDESC